MEEKEGKYIFSFLLSSSLALEQSSFYNNSMSPLHHHSISLASLRSFEIDFKEEEVNAMPLLILQYILLLAAGSDSK